MFHVHTLHVNWRLQLAQRETFRLGQQHQHELQDGPQTMAEEMALVVGEEDMFVKGVVVEEAGVGVVMEAKGRMEAVAPWVTEVVVAKKAREEWEGENQEVEVGSPHEKGTPHWNYLRLHPLSCLSHLLPVEQFPCNHHL